MRPRIFNSQLIAGCHGLCVRRFGSRPTATKTISLTVSSKAPKQAVLDKLNRHLTNSSRKPTHVPDGNNSDHGAAVFASRNFATWLEDENFMSGVLGTLFKSNTSGQVNSRDVQVLCAVTDGLTPTRVFDEPQTGFSILYGSAEGILPGLWDANDFESNVNLDRESSVSFLSNPLPRHTWPLDITLPLANTVFQNGRRSTLFASRWQSDHDGPMARTMIREKRTQTIWPGPNPAGHTSPYLPLLPLTPPRKIVAGLGNIVRQVEIDGSPTPASKELEGLIPKVFDSRSNRDESYSPGPIGVWCWVLPPHVVENQHLLDLKVFQPESSQSEAELSLETMGTFSELISHGCRLHKILSGGGGWGAKQGLLSLDPETNYSPPDQDNVEMFIKAFQERDNPNPSEGLVTPGSYLMFCIEPHWAEKEVGLSQRMTPTTALGVAPNNDEELRPASLSNKIEIVDDHFGVVSKAGLFLKATTLPHMTGVGNTSGSSKAPRTFTTKVDFPRASFLL
ncbi:hypothetical protein F4677DRAFT_414820 [Hypoxylon crocopeplum]|nr:hypothetical protein F4677DRAFT_414820 [Hypoxylon crocopeplum]